jgi:hypothetical protein
MIRFVRGFGRFWYDFIVGDDWKIAVGVCLMLALGAVLVAATSVPDTAITLLVLAGILAVAAASIVAAR